MSGFISNLLSSPATRAARRQLEAFFAALPLEYCGFKHERAGKSGTLIYSRGFARLLGITRLQTIHDIENALGPSDAAALEGMFLNLMRTGEPFSLTVRTLNDDRILRLSGARGRDLGAHDTYDIIWLQDDTQAQRELDSIRADMAVMEDDRARHRMILHAIPMPLWIADSTNDIAWVNAAYCATVDKSEDDIIDDQIWLPLTLPGSTEDPIAKMKDTLEACRKTGQSQQFRARMIIGGKRRIIDLVFLPVPDSDIITIFTMDVTAEEDRIAEHKRYVAAQSSLLEQLHTAVAIFSADHRLEFHNTAFASLWGIEESYLNEHPKLGDVMEKLRELRRLPEQADFRSFKQSWLNMFTGLLSAHEEMLYLPNASAVRMLVTPHPMGGLMMTFEDVTSRLALESSYNTLMAVQRETLENLTEGVAVFGPDGRLKLSNPRFMSLWDLNPEDMQGDPHVTELATKQRKFFGLGWQDVAQVLTAQGLQRTEETHILTRDDDTVLECRSVPLPDGGVMVTHRDITDKTKVENALRDKAHALEDAEKLKTDFLANVSYQLRTPLNAMTGFAEILSNKYFGDLNEKQAEYTQGILDAGARLVSLIDDILDLSTIEAGYLSLSFEEIEVSNLLNDIHNLTHEWALRETLTATLDCPSDIGTIEADPRRIKQILLNLIRNAINFTPAGGTISLSAEGGNDFVRISVSDSGIGIPEDEQAGIFTPFGRAQSADTKNGGHNNTGPGLGLSLVQNITHLHGGEVLLNSHPGVGTTITLILPRHQVSV